MANPTIEYADIYRCLMLVIKLLGIADSNYPTVPTVVASSPWTKKQILDLILQSDVEVRTWIADTPNHPLRNAITFSTSASLADGAAVPPSQSSHREVLITNSAVTKVGELADSLDELQRWKDNPKIYGTYKWHYFINNGHIYFSHASSTATIVLADITVNRTANGNDGSISTPVRYEWAVVANTMVMTAIHLQDSSNKKLYGSIAAEYQRQVKSGALSLPVPEIFQRLNT